MEILKRYHHGNIAKICKLQYLKSLKVERKLIKSIAKFSYQFVSNLFITNRKGW